MFFHALTEAFVFTFRSMFCSSTISSPAPTSLLCIKTRSYWSNSFNSSYVNMISQCRRWRETSAVWPVPPAFHSHRPRHRMYATYFSVSTGHIQRHMLILYHINLYKPSVTLFITQGTCFCARRTPKCRQISYSLTTHPLCQASLMCRYSQLLLFDWRFVRSDLLHV